MKKPVVNIFNKQKNIEIEEGVCALLRICCRETLKHECERLNKEINITFVNDKEMKSLNSKFRGVDSSTDVLSFCENDVQPEAICKEIKQKKEFRIGRFSIAVTALETNTDYLGDIVLSLETAQRQAAENFHSLRYELAYLTIHSMLHLLGYDHAELIDEAVMFSKQDEIIVRILHKYKIIEHN